MTSARSFALISMMLALGVGTHGSAQETQSAPRIEQLSWLVGCWSLQQGDTLVEEHWLEPAGGAMLGVGRSIRGGKMTEFEFMALREVNGRLSFVAIPSGQKETVFPFARGSATELVFEDLSHDFPQRVIYRNVNGALAARIEGTANGKSRGMDFSYQRCE